jgi:hypothetical protein
MYRNELSRRELSVILLSRYRPDISRRAGVTTLNTVNFLIASISPNSNSEESALPEGLVGFDHSIEIWLAEVTRESRPLVLAKMNDIAKRKGGPRNVAQLVSQEFGRFSETPGSQQQKHRACGRILLGSLRILFLNHPVSKILRSNLPHAKLCSRFDVPGNFSL